jgi:hypothetical protein
MPYYATTCNIKEEKKDMSKQEQEPEPFKLGCSNCSTSLENIARTKARLTPEAEKIIDDGVKKTGLLKDCYLCLTDEMERLPPHLKAGISMIENKTIEYENVTIKVPKVVLNFIRNVKLDKNDPSETVESWIAWHVVDDVRGFCEGAEFRDWADALGLSPVFVELLGDERYAETESETES